MEEIMKSLKFILIFGLMSQNLLAHHHVPLVTVWQCVGSYGQIFGKGFYNLDIQFRHIATLVKHTRKTRLYGHAGLISRYEGTARDSAVAACEVEHGRSGHGGFSCRVTYCLHHDIPMQEGF